MLDFARFRVLTFDCYGTLIDWEAGILACMQRVLSAHGVSLADEEILRLYADLESHIESRCYQPYRRILERVVHGYGERLGFAASPAEMRSLPESLKSWKPFPDTVPALRALKSKYRLAIISNTDDDLFAHTARLLEVPFDHVITAQQVGTYKPSLNNFHAALDRIGLARDQVLHVAESLYHDIAPARSLGLSTVWIHRNKSSAGATPAASAQPDLELPDVASLAALTVGYVKP